MPESGSSIADRLAAHLRSGTLLDLIPDRPPGELLDETEMRAWDPGHDVDANLLRDLLRGRVVTDPDPRGIRLRGARILGPLDLDHLNSTIALFMENCLLEQGFSAVGAHLPELDLAHCRLSHPIEFAFIGDGLSVDGSVALAGSMLSADTIDGAVRLLDARIGSQLNCSGATLRNPSGPALYADGLQTEGGVFFSGGFTADGAGELGAIRLLNARIGGELNCSGATLRNPSGPALRAEGVQTNGGVFFNEGFTADGAGELGAIRVLGARIGGQLNCSGATLRNHSGPALIADRLQADGVLLRRGFTADGTGKLGAIRLPSARIGGQLACRGATLFNPTGPAFVADLLQVDGDVFFDEGFIAVGAGELGAIRLPSARIGGQLDCSGATLCNPTGSAFVADNVQIGGEVFLSKGLTAVGAGELSTMSLRAARIRGRLDCRRSTVTSRSDPRHRWNIDGMGYTGVPLLDLGSRHREAWLELLRDATPYYASQPYQQLAAVYRGLGHDSDVRASLMAQRRDQLSRGALTRLTDRCWVRFTGALLGYGYQPWRALLYLAGVLFVSVALALLFGGHGALAHPDPASVGAPAPALVPCTPVQTIIGTGLDLGTPFLSTSRDARGSCTTTTTGTGNALTIIRVVLQLFAWALAALFIAGFTGIVRTKP